MEGHEERLKKKNEKKKQEKKKEEKKKEDPRKEKQKEREQGFHYDKGTDGLPAIHQEE